MSRRPPDRGLRRLVAELATAAPEDLDAILEGLETAQRRTVTGLLADYAGAAEAPETPPAAPPPAAPAPPRTAGLSPWLALRLKQGPRPDADGGADPGGTRISASAARRAPGRIVAMTPAALRALKACAVSLETQRKPPRRTGAADRVLSRVRRAILGRRLAS